MEIKGCVKIKKGVFLPAFLAVRYIIFFFFFAARVPQRIPEKIH